MKNYQTYSDEELLDLLRGGEAELMDYLLEKYRPLVKKKANAMYLMGGDTDDLNQEGMIGLYKAIRDYSGQEDTSFATFANICVSRQMYSAIEASNRKKHSPLNSYVSIEASTDETSNEYRTLAELQSVMDNPENRFIDQENVAQIEERIEKALSKYEKKVLNLYLKGLNYVQISEILDKSPKSVDNAIQRIRGKIKA